MTILSKFEKFPKNTLDDFLEEMNRFVAVNIPLEINGNSKYNKREIIKSLLFTALQSNFTNDGCRNLYLIAHHAPRGNTILYHIKKVDPKEIFTSFTTMIKMICKFGHNNGALRRSVDLAIDFTKIPFYGNPNCSMLHRIKPEQGTSYGYKYATISILNPNERFAPYVIPVDHKKSKEEIVVNLITAIKSKGLKINLVRLDRGFYTKEVVRKLSQMDIKFLIPAIRNPDIKRNLCRIQGSKIIDHKFGRISTKLAMIIKDNKKIPFITNLHLEQEDSDSLLKIYRTRWGIETSYRMFGNYRPKTTSTNYSVRLFYFMFSVVYYNIWILFNLIALKNGYNSLTTKAFINETIRLC